jgi:hypothetical protein
MSPNTPQHSSDHGPPADDVGNACARRPLDSFTPDTLRIVGLSSLGPDPNIFVLSSKGGLVKLPSLSGLASIDLSGSEWTDLS